MSNNSFYNQNNLNDTISRIESELIQMKINNQRRTASHAKMKNFKDKDEDSEINSFQNISLGNVSKNKRMLKLNKNKNDSDDDSDEMNTGKQSSNGNLTHSYQPHNNNHKGINLNECFDDTNLINDKDNDLSNQHNSRRVLKRKRNNHIEEESIDSDNNSFKNLKDKSKKNKNDDDEFDINTAAEDTSNIYQDHINGESLAKKMKSNNVSKKVKKENIGDQTIKFDKHS